MRRQKLRDIFLLVRSHVLINAISNESRTFSFIFSSLTIFGCLFNAIGLVLIFMDSAAWSIFMICGSLGIGLGNIGLTLLPKSQYKRQEWILNIALMCPGGRVGEVIELARKEGDDFLATALQRLRVRNLAESDRKAVGEVLASTNRAARIAGIKILGGRELKLMAG